MCRHELADALTEGGTRRSNHIGFRAAAVGHHSICPEVGCDAGHDLAHLADRRRDQNKIGISHFLARIDPESIDDAEFKRLRQGRDAATKADHFLDFACCLECQRKRTANQANTKNNDFPEFRLHRKTFHHRDTETQRKTRESFSLLSVPLCLCG